MSKVGNLYLTVFWIVVAVAAVAGVGRDLRFYYDQTVVPVKTPADVRKLKDNAMAEISLPLDVEKTYPIEFIASKQQFQLIPFEGVGYRLMWVVDGEMTQRTIGTLRPPFKGRVVEESVDKWSVYGKRLKLKKLFAEGQIKLPENTMLVYDAPKKFPHPWAMFVFVGAIAYLLWKAYSLGRWALTRGGMAA